MKKLLVINGVNLNMLGIREKELYGEKSFSALEKYIRECAKELGVKVVLRHSNHEGKLVEFIQKAYGKFDGIIINAGAYTHTSIAILDALKAVAIPTVEVHLTDINAREDFRKVSYVGLYADICLAGNGFEGYREAMEHFLSKN